MVDGGWWMVDGVSATRRTQTAKQPLASRIKHPPSTIHHPTSVVLTVAAALLTCGSAMAAPPPRSETLEFLHTLRDHGYGDFAAEYLQAHEGDAGLAKDVRELWDLELANSL